MTPDNAAGAPAIQFKQTSVVYPNGVRGLDGVDLDIPRGDLIVIVGLSGAGKSTLLRAINGLVQITGGDVEVEGKSVRQSRGAALRELRGGVGMIFQDYRLVRRISVLQNVLIGRVARVPTWRQLLGLWPKADVELALESLDRVGLADRAYVKAGQLSGGQQQRVGIARALAQKPSVILADEPVASLDPALRHSVMRHIEALNREEGMTVLCTLHDVDLIQRYATRLVALRDGRLVYQGGPGEFTAETFREIYGEDAEPAAGLVVGEES